MWKLQDFYVTFLREINFAESRSSKAAIFAILGALNFAYMDRYLLWKSVKIHKYQSFEMAEFVTLHFAILISRKIWVTENFCNFHTVPMDKFYSSLSVIQKFLRFGFTKWFCLVNVCLDFHPAKFLASREIFYFLKVISDQYL